MTLVFILVGIGLLFLFCAIFFRNASVIVQLALVALGLFSWGLAGLPIVINKEVDFTVFSLEGFPAVFFGIALSLTGFFGAILFFVGIVRLLSK